MKKFLYVILLLAVLIAVAYALKNNQTPKTVSEEVIAMPNEAEETIVVVDEEPTADETDGEIVAEDVVEENPEDTADEGETIVD